MGHLPEPILKLPPAPTLGFRQKAVGQNQWYHFGVRAPPILVYFSGDLHVHWVYAILSHGQTGPWARRDGWQTFATPRELVEVQSRMAEEPIGSAAGAAPVKAG